ncbi:hypothetical protein CR513_33666, partial [Mucuna pruriens]
MLEGLPKAILEERLLQLQREGDWSAFMDAYGLLVYGIMLFPQIKDYFGTFLTKRDRGENPIIVVQANTYYSLNYYLEKNRKGLRCYTSLLYLWMTAHLFHNGKKMTFPIENHHWSCVRPLTKNKREDAIIKCEGFPTVPLMDTQGAINYNPELALRQVGYHMVLPPTEEVVTPFIIHGIGAQNGEFLKRIWHPCKSII